MITSRSMPSTVAEDPLINPLAIDEAHIHVVAAIIRSPTAPRQFLIAQRQQGKHLQDYWELPGGKLEPGETRWQGLQRELREEIGILAIVGAPFMQVYFRYPERNVLLDTWLVEAFEGEVSSREQQVLAWIDETQIDAYRFPPADVPILDAIKRNATTGT